MYPNRLFTSNSNPFRSPCQGKFFNGSSLEAWVDGKFYDDFGDVPGRTIYSLTVRTWVFARSVCARKTLGARVFELVGRNGGNGWGFARVRGQGARKT